jgi:hypothetical protein
VPALRHAGSQLLGVSRRLAGVLPRSDFFRVGRRGLANAARLMSRWTATSKQADSDEARVTLTILGRYIEDLLQALLCGVSVGR